MERRKVSNEIKLTDKVLAHITKRHPEVASYANKIGETVKSPDLVIRGSSDELKALKFFTELHIGPKFLVVIYRKIQKEKVIITAYFTSSATRVKGEVIWRKR